MARKRRKKSPLRRLENKADRALSLYVRARTFKEFGVCPLCSKNPITVNFHFISRRRKILRWRAENTIGSCRTCNYIEQFLPDYSRAFFIRRYGAQTYLSLVDESKTDFVPTEQYLQGIVDTFTQALALLGTSNPS